MTLFARAIGRNSLWLASGFALLSATAAAVLACGPFLTDLVTVTTIDPADTARFARGDLGVVRPHFRRRNLLQAYRVLSGGQPLQERAAPSGAVPASAVDAWLELADGRPSNLSANRSVAQYQYIVNCNDAAFAQAIHTYRDRQERFGSTSPEVRTWLDGQIAVFANCSDGDLRLPPALPTSSNPLIRADRAYQTAAAYFYALDYDEAERRFRAIALDAQSPWQSYGRLLAARSIIRRVTTRSDPPADGALARQWSAADLAQFDAAAADLEAVVADRSAAALHASARGLLAFLACRTRPVERLHELSAILTRDAVVDAQDIIDYVWLMDRLVGDTNAYHVADSNRAALVASDDFTAWVLTMQDTSPDLDAALVRWRTTGSPAWLTALLWRVAPDHSAAAELLQAASALDHDSPAYPTIAFLRVRLLQQQGKFDDARNILATLPERADGTGAPETINLYKAQRMRLSRSLDEFLLNAPRDYVVNVTESFRGQPIPRQPVFDDDAAEMLNSRLPLQILVASGESSRLPARLRARVAASAFVRSVVLRNDALGIRAAAALAALAERLRPDLQRYVDASDANSRHRAGLLTILRTPGLHIGVRGIDDDQSITADDLHRNFDHQFGPNWWCGSRSFFGGDYPAASELVRLVYADKSRGVDVAFPPFVTAEEQRTVDAEQKSLAAIGSGREYLANEVLAWAQEEPRNPDVAEALARVVEGWRWGCGAYEKWPLAQRAFQALHRNFPQSDWAKRTKYWHKG